MRPDECSCAHMECGGKRRATPLRFAGALQKDGVLCGWEAKNLAPMAHKSHGNSAA